MGGGGRELRVERVVVTPSEFRDVLAASVGSDLPTTAMHALPKHEWACWDVGVRRRGGGDVQRRLEAEAGGGGQRRAEAGGGKRS